MLAVFQCVSLWAFSLSVHHVVLSAANVSQVNGTKRTPPLTLTNGVEIYLSGKFIVLETAFGLRVRFDGNHHADVTLPKSYSGLLCGLCGKERSVSLVPPCRWLAGRRLAGR